MEEYYSSKGKKSIAGVHASLATQDRFTALRLKIKMTLFPKGKEVNGLLFQCQRQPELAVGCQLVMNWLVSSS